MLIQCSICPSDSTFFFLVLLFGFVEKRPTALFPKRPFFETTKCDCATNTPLAPPPLFFCPLDLQNPKLSLSCAKMQSQFFTLLSVESRIPTPTLLLRRSRSSLFLHRQSRSLTLSQPPSFFHHPPPPLPPVLSFFGRYTYHDPARMLVLDELCFVGC